MESPISFFAYHVLVKNLSGIVSRFFRGSPEVEEKFCKFVGSRVLSHSPGAKSIGIFLSPFSLIPKNVNS
jgi:hypothetical protein